MGMEYLAGGCSGHSKRFTTQNSAASQKAHQLCPGFPGSLTGLSHECPALAGQGHPERRLPSHSTQTPGQDPHRLQVHTWDTQRPLDGILKVPFLVRNPIPSWWSVGKL